MFIDLRSNASKVGTKGSFFFVFKGYLIFDYITIYLGPTEILQPEFAKISLFDAGSLALFYILALYR